VETRSVTVEWFERGETKGKEIELEQWSPYISIQKVQRDVQINELKGVEIMF